MPTAPGADYFYRLWIDDYGERIISARLTAGQDARSLFWDSCFELAGFRDDVEKLEIAFCEMLEILLIHETRIVQTKGLLWWGFHCHYREGEVWKLVSGGSLSLRWFKAPPIPGSRQTYSSAPISSASSIT
jgi:hypothetical protein